MAWLSSYTDAPSPPTYDNKVIDGATTLTEQFSYVGTTTTVQQRTVTHTNYRYVGMTKAAADTCMSEVNDPPDVLASAKRENDAGAYTVEVLEITRGAWAAV